MSNELTADRITIRQALMFPVWKLVYAAEPERGIDVRMTYAELKRICDTLDAMRWRDPVKEPPEDGQWIIVKTEYFGFICCRYNGWADDDDEEGKLIAWLPLPKLEEAEDDKM